VLLCNSSLVAQELQVIDFAPPEVGIIKTESAPVIDGNFDDPAWSNIIPLSDFIQREPDNGIPVSERTVVKVMFDDDNLYFAFACYDHTPNEIVATEMRRDQSLLDNDAVEIFLDTYHDHRNAFYFSTNALGAQRDGVLTSNTDDMAQNWDWNGIWECASTITDVGWNAEVRIPFKTLRFGDEKELTWGMNLSRIIPRKREEAYWSFISRDLGYWGRSRIDVFGHVSGISGISQPEKLQIKPFILAGLKRDFEEREPYEKVLEVGGDVKYLLTSNITLDLTVNTDFAQVEADQEQVNLSRFELFFPEKREFFLEGASTFDFAERIYSPIIPATRLFFSRRIGLSEDNEIVPIIGGIKMTGKSGSYGLGLMSIFTDRTSYINEDDEDVYIPQSNYTVARVKHDLFEQSYIGVIALNKESLEDASYNRTFGIDANIYLTNNFQFSGMVAKTSSPDMEGNDFAYYGDLLYQDDFFNAMLSQNSIEENFNPEMGFVPRENVRKSQLNLGISPRPDFLDIRQTTLFTDLTYFTDQGGNTESKMFYNGAWALFNNGSQMILIHAHNYERLTEEFEIHDDMFIPIGSYKFNSFYGEYNSDNSKTLSGKFSITAGEFYSGDIFGYTVGANLKLSSNFAMNLEYNHNNVNLAEGSFNTDLLGARFIYTFSPKMFAKAFVQWNSDREVIIGNFLFNLIHTPGSDLYFVYNEELSTETGTLRSLNRTILLKMTYLFSI